MDMPTTVSRYFWGDNLKELDLQKHEKYIAQTLLEHGDGIAVKWLVSVISMETLKLLFVSLKLSKKSHHFWSLYLS